MAYSSNIHVAVYQVLDQVLVADVAPPGAKATIHSVIDDLHAASAPRPMIEQAEGISLQLHYLESAVARGDFNPNARSAPATAVARRRLAQHPRRSQNGPLNDAKSGISPVTSRGAFAYQGPNRLTSPRNGSPEARGRCGCSPAAGRCHSGSIVANGPERVRDRRHSRSDSSASHRRTAATCSRR